MEPKTVTIDEIIATFSSHIEKHYPSPKDFRRNFNLLLKGKRERADEGGYAVSLEKNIVFLRDLVADAEALVERLLGPAGDDAPAETGIVSILEGLEKKAHETTARRHREAFVEGTADEFSELRGDPVGVPDRGRDGGGRGRSGVTSRSRRITTWGTWLWAPRVPWSRPAGA